ncbi:hypothetical protein LCGC14_2294430, partial [marine sediment metagenome]
MADITLLEAAKHSQDIIERSVTKIIVESSPILEVLPMRTINGPAFRYHQEQSLGTVAYRGVGGTYVADAGVINPLFEPLVILGGEVAIDNFEVEVMQNLLNLKSEKYRMKARQVGIQFTTSFFEGDTAVDPFEFDGLRKRLTGGQKLAAGTNGNVLTLALLDELLDKVVGDSGQKVLYMNKSIRRQLTKLVREQTGSSFINMTQDAFGRQQVAYSGTPVRVVEREDDGSTILDFDETQGGSNITASVYCVRYGSDYVMGIQSRSVPSVKD